MADELRIYVDFRFSRHGVARSIIRPFVLDLDFAEAIQGAQSIGTTLTSISLPARSGGWIWLRNLDATNFISIYPQSLSADPIARLNPGEFMLCRLDDGVSPLWLLADTAACEVEYLTLAGPSLVFLELESSTEETPSFVEEEDGVTPIDLEP